MKKNKCPFCGKDKEEFSYRCDTCHLAWQDGYKQGKEAQKCKLDSILYKLSKLVKDST